MTGSNCSIYGCNTSRRHKHLSQIRLPNPNKFPQWRKEMLAIITRDRVLDKKFKEQIEKNNVYICEKHFQEEDFYHYVTCKKLREGALPSLNLPVKSCSSTTTSSQRSSSTITKRKMFQQQHEIKTDSIPPANCYNGYSDFLQRIQKLKLPSKWIIVDNQNYIEIKFHEPIYTVPKFQIFVNKDLTYTLRCYGWTISENTQIMTDFPSFNRITLSDYLKKVETYKICKGLHLVEFKEAINLKHHVIPKLFNFSSLDLKDTDVVPLYQEEYLRSPTCPLLIHENKCADCMKMEVKVRAELNQKRRVLTSPVLPNTPLSFVSPDRLISTIKNHRQENKLLRKENASLNSRLQSALLNNSVPVDSCLNDDLVDIFKGIPESKVPPFMKLFWQEQQKYLRTKHKSQIRYHPAIIKYCLSIAAKSSSAYEQLRLDGKDGSGILVLPSQRTLRDYRNYIKPKQGFNPEVINDLTEKTKDFTDFEHYSTILIDEMKVQEDLVWNKNTGELIGFVDLGDEQVNESLLEDKQKLATHIMVFMVKSIKNPLSFSFANFATDGASSSQIFSLFWKAVSILKISCNLKIVAAVADGASINRRFMQMNRDPDYTEDIVYRVKNEYTFEDRYIYFFADAPHLIKTARNCVWSSGSDFSSRLLWNSGFYILWQHIKNLFYEDLDNGLHLMPKLTTDHILLNSYSKMRVNLASQVLSESVGVCLKEFSSPEAQGTAEFCQRFDKFFDCFNVRNTVEHIRKQKEFLAPYKSPDDKRFKWLDGFLSYLGKWKDSVETREGTFTPTDRNNMFLSLPTYNGIKISISSLKEIVPFLLKNGFEYVLSEKFCQDDLENYFGRQRAIGRRKDNPSVKDTMYNDNIIKAQYDVKPIAGANCRIEINTSEIPETPLKKRK